MSHSTPDRGEGVPVFRVNFYLMGMSEVDESVTLQIGDNMEYLNEEFEGRIKFKLHRIYMDENHAYMPDLHQAVIMKNGRLVDDIISDIERAGAINVYLFETYSEQPEVALLGFTPVLTGHHQSYEYNSPRFDRVYIAYPGLADRSTLVHEMGHFLGLSHPWDMNSLDVQLMGLQQDSVQRINHMTYNPEVSSFTDEQLSRMHHFAMEFRKYLLSHVEYKAEYQPN